MLNLLLLLLSSSLAFAAFLRLGPFLILFIGKPLLAAPKAPRETLSLYPVRKEVRFSALSKIRI